MRLLHRLAALLILLAVNAFAAEDPHAAAVDSQIARFLTALEFGAEAKAAYAVAISSGELDGQTAQALRRISEERFVELAVPAFRGLVSLEEATAMADFYDSDVMRAMLAEQKRSGGAAPVAKNATQAAAVQRFTQSKAGQAALRVQQALATTEFAEQFEAALGAELEKR